MSLTVSSLYPGIVALLQGRPITAYNNTAAEYIRKSVLELSENYKFPGLQTTGPVVELVPLQAVYAPSYFLATDDAELEVNKVNSFFIYNYGYTALSSASSSNSGYNLAFSTINNIEVLINVSGIPQKWTRHEGDIWLGSCPDQNYSIYMRYQKEHPFPLAGGENAGNDSILLPNSWQDVLEYSAAMRAARDMNLQSKANELYTALYGDSKFQSTGGLEGQPGLIFGRTSQENRDQTTSVKCMRLRMGRQR
jgi:hypothetical protein